MKSEISNAIGFNVKIFNIDMYDFFRLYSRGGPAGRKRPAKASCPARKLVFSILDI